MGEGLNVDMLTGFSTSYSLRFSYSQTQNPFVIN